MPKLALWILGALAPVQDHQQWALEAERLLRTGQLQPAEELLQRATQAAPDRAEYRLLFGILYLQMGLADRALPELQVAAEELPEVAPVQYNLGLALGLLERFEEATVPLRVALRLQPKDIDTLFNLAHVLISNGKLQEGRERLQDLLALADGHAEAHYLLGRVLLETTRLDGELDAVEEHLQRALQIDPGHAQALAQLGLLRLREGLPKKAIPLFRQALELRPEDLLARYNLGRAYLQSGNRREGQRLLLEFRALEGASRDVERVRRLLRRSPSHLGLRLRLVELLIQQNGVEEAARELAAVLRQHPEHVSASLLQVILERRLGHTERAWQRLRALQNAHPQDEQVQQAMRAWIASE
jgi:tetratricopeptide (TPR) repeat protein